MLVRTVDLARFLLRDVAQRKIPEEGRLPPAVVMKLDVEGG